MAKNILVTSAGRRVALVKLLEKAAGEFDPSIRVLAADADPEWSAAVQGQGKRIALPKISDPNFSTQLAKLVAEENIGLVIPLIDPELLIYSEIQGHPAFSDTRFLLSSREFILRSSNKIASMHLFEEMGLRVPQHYTSWPGHPVFARPAGGSGSISAQLVLSEEQFNWLAKDDRDFVFTEYLDTDHFDSFTIDAFYSKGQLICCVPRKRVEVRAGEISKGLTVKAEFYEMIRERIRTLEGAHGPIGIQVFKHKSSGTVYGIEINARFCGGYPLSEAAGARFTKYLIEMELGTNDISFREDWKEGLKMLRYDEALFL